MRFVSLPVLALVVGALSWSGAAFGSPAPRQTEPASVEDEADRLWREQVLEHGDVDVLLAELDGVASSEAETERRRTEALELGIALLRRRGELRTGLRWVDQLIALRGGPEDRLARARLLDATGEPRSAYEAYEEVLGELGDPEMVRQVRLRVALLAMELGDTEGRDALAAFAREEGADTSFRNRAAIVLAVLDRPVEALDLFAVEGEGTERFREDVRVAEWGMRAEQFERAQEAAWSAVSHAALRRDRDYAIAVLVEAYRSADQLGALIERIQAEPDPNEQMRRLWVDLLRETGRTDEAIELFRRSSGGAFTLDMRLDLLEMYREAGREDAMVAEYRRLIEAQPLMVAWYEGLSRHYLERGDPDTARAVWDPVMAGEQDTLLLEAVDSLGGLGQDDLALACAERCVETDRQRFPALLSMYDLHHRRGRSDEAVQTLQRMDELAPPAAAERYDLSEAWEHLGRHAAAVEALEGVIAARGVEDAGEDTQMRLAWLYSEMGDEERAVTAWRELWGRVNSIPRRRYVEDRMMTVAARLGRLADIAIELEEKLFAGEAEQKDTGLLVRLYTKVNDAVSASEIIDEFLQSTGGDAVEALQEKARVYLTCTDYFNYEKTVRELIEADPEGEPDYLRQLAMSQLERGKPDEAREILQKLAEVEGGSDSSEFEAGVLSLAGMRDEAIVAYRKGIARFPDRIESYLLLANLMKEVGQVDRAVGMFQHLAETAEKDDLFTIAIDGLLNLEAPPKVLEWARRVALERLAGRHDKMYLYQLVSDLAEQVDDIEGMMVALENSLPIASTRRPSVLRELMDLSATGSNTFVGGRRWEGDSDRHLAYGRRLIGLSEVVPPQVYLDLGRAFLEAGEVRNAAKTFGLARDLPDYEHFQQQAAQLFEEAGFVAQALRTYEHVLVSRSTDVALIAKVGELHEQLGRDEIAYGLYRRALAMLLTRRPLQSLKEEEQADPNDPFLFFAARNVDEFDQHYDRILIGLLATAPDAEAVTDLLAAPLQMLEADLETLAASADEDSVPVLRKYPRVLHRAEFCRRLAFAFGRPELADALDSGLLAAYPKDEGLLEELVRARASWGLYASARVLIRDSGRPEPEKERVLFLVGGGSNPGVGQTVSLLEASRLLLPLLVTDRREEARSLLRRVDLSDLPAEETGRMAALFAAARWLEDEDSLLRTGRQWVRLLVDNNEGSFEIEPILGKCRTAMPPDHYRSLCEYLVGLILEKPDERSSFLTMLPDLQEPFEEPLVSTDQVFELFENYGEAYAYGLAPVLQILPSDERGAAMRTLWPKIQNTQRAVFLMQLVQQFTEPMGEELHDFVLASLGDALDDATLFEHFVRILWSCEENLDTALGVAEIVRKKTPNDWKVTALEAFALHRLGREEEALAKVEAVLEQMVSAEQDFNVTFCQRQLKERFLPQHRGLFLSVFDRLEESGGKKVVISKQRLALYDISEEAEQYGVVLAAALEQHPEDVSLLQLRYNFEMRQGSKIAALAVLERMIEVEPKNRQRRVQLVRAWIGLENPVAALEAMRKYEVELDEMHGAAPGVKMPRALLSGARVVLLGSPTRVMKKTSKKVEGKLEAATLVDLKKAVDADRIEEARSQFRRLWRDFPVGDPSARRVVFFGPSTPTVLAWPEDSKEEEDEPEGPPRRGGLESFREEDPEPVEPTNAYDVLASRDFGREEITRLLRTQDPRGLDTVQGVLDGLRHALQAEEGDAFLARMLRAAREGRAGKADAMMLLALLDEEQPEADEAMRQVLGDLQQNVGPQDGLQLQRLARVQARLGSTDVAKRLFAWCATQAETGFYYSPFAVGETIDVNSLVDDVRDSLEGEDRLEIVDTILEYADPGVDEYGSREEFEVLALSTWTELLGREEALRRGRTICDRVLDVPSGLRRDPAAYAAELLAHAGEIDAAVRCLEVGLCKFDRSVFETNDPYLWYMPDYFGFLGDDSIRRLFPRDPEGWADASAWMVAAAESLSAWVEDERANSSTVVRCLGVIVRRLADQGLPEDARSVIERMVVLREGLSAPMQLWVVDACREAGEDERAYAIERELLTGGLLRSDRIADVLEAVAVAEGLQVALKLGAEVAQSRLREDLLGALARFCRELGDEQAAAEWEAKWAAAQEASKALEPPENAEG